MFAMKDVLRALKGGFSIILSFPSYRFGHTREELLRLSRLLGKTVRLFKSFLRAVHYRANVTSIVRSLSISSFRLRCKYP